MQIYIWDQLSTVKKNGLLKRPNHENHGLLADSVREILKNVKTKKDKALIDYTAQYDNVDLTNIAVSEEELSEANVLVSKEEQTAIDIAIERIRAYHEAQLGDNWQFETLDGIFCQRQRRPIANVGLYVPGGTAPLVSTTMMLAIPALIAGCKQRVMCTPPRLNKKVDPRILYAAKKCGIQQIYKIGGAQAIAAMCYGTETVSKVDKIFGPGNQWVTEAKMQCIQDSGLAIDLPAGPSELVVIADESAYLNYIAADLLSQAEHDSSAQVLFITTSYDYMNKLKPILYELLSQLPRREIAEKSLKNSRFIVTESIEQAIDISNIYAPEHLSLQVNAPDQYLPLIQNAGTVFVGHFSAESMGDYITGANHVLPTAGSAKSFSGLSVADFMKWIGFQSVDKQGLKRFGPVASELAKMEQLFAHEHAINIRLKDCV